MLQQSARHSCCKEPYLRIMDAMYLYSYGVEHTVKVLTIYYIVMMHKSGTKNILWIVYANSIIVIYSGYAQCIVDYSVTMYSSHSATYIYLTSL